MHHRSFGREAWTHISPWNVSNVLMLKIHTRIFGQITSWALSNQQSCHFDLLAACLSASSSPFLPHGYHMLTTALFCLQFILVLPFDHFLALAWSGLEISFSSKFLNGSGKCVRWLWKLMFIQVGKAVTIEAEKTGRLGSIFAFFVGELKVVANCALWVVPCPTLSYNHRLVRLSGSTFLLKRECSFEGRNEPVLRFFFKERKVLL